MSHGVSTTNRNKNLSRNRSKYTKLKELYKDNDVVTNNLLEFKPLSNKEIKEGRARAKAYIKRRNRINILIGLTIAIPIISLVWYFFQILFL